MGKLAGLCCSGFQGVCQFCTHIFVLSEVCAAGTTNKSFGAKKTSYVLGVQHHKTRVRRLRETGWEGSLFHRAFSPLCFTHLIIPCKSSRLPPRCQQQRICLRPPPASITVSTSCSSLLTPQKTITLVQTTKT